MESLSDRRQPRTPLFGQIPGGTECGIKCCHALEAQVLEWDAGTQARQCWQFFFFLCRLETMRRGSAGGSGWPSSTISNCCCGYRATYRVTADLVGQVSHWFEKTFPLKSGVHAKVALSEWSSQLSLQALDMSLQRDSRFVREHSCDEA